MGRMAECHELLSEAVELSNRMQGFSLCNAPPEFLSDMKLLTSRMHEWNQKNPLVAPKNLHAGERVRHPSYYETLIKRRLEKEGIHP